MDSMLLPDEVLRQEARLGCRNPTRKPPRLIISVMTDNEIAAGWQELHNEDSSPASPVEEENGNVAFSDLKPSQKKALTEFKAKLEESIFNKHLFPPPNEGNSNGDENLEDISLWGVPLLPNKNHECLNTILLKFLRAREFKVSDAMEMLQKTLNWRKEFKINGILEENLGAHLKNVVYMGRTDKEGHPLCYNVYGAFKDKEIYNKAFGSEEKCEEFLRWRIQLMEKGIQNLSFKSGKVGSMVQIYDLRNSPGPASKELRVAMKKALSLLQDNYPEFVSRNMFINVPFRCYAYHALFSRFLSQRAKSKCVFARPSRVQETLLKYIAPENLPVQYGGLKREGDVEFSDNYDGVSEISIKSGAVGTIEILVAEPGVTMLWDIIVVGYDVTYKEEFIPDDDCSYKVLIQKHKRMEESIRNSFYINEPGKVVLTIENHTYKKKKVFYRSKSKPTTLPLYNFLK